MRAHPTDGPPLATEQPHFLSLLKTAFTDERLGPFDWIVMMYLKDRQGKNGHAWPSIATIARECKIGRNTVLRSLATLESTGWITTERGPGTSNRYAVQQEPNQSPTGTTTSPPQGLPSPSQGLVPVPHRDWGSPPQGRGVVPHRDTNYTHITTPNNETGDSDGAEVRTAVEAYALAVPFRSTAERLCVEKTCHELSSMGDCGPKAVLEGLAWGARERKPWKTVQTHIKSAAARDGLIPFDRKAAPASSKPPVKEWTNEL